MHIQSCSYLRVVPAVLLLLAGNGLAHASYVQLTAASQLSPTDAIANYPQPDSGKVASPFSESASGNMVTFLTASNAPFTVDHQGASFFGDFPSGTPLLYNGGNGPDLINFSTPVSEFGVTVESNVVDSYLYTITFLSGTTTDLTYTISDDGLSSFFVGARGTGTSTFNQVRIASEDNDFAIGPVSFSASASSVPEPSSWVLCVAGIGVLLAFRAIGARSSGLS